VLAYIAYQVFSSEAGLVDLFSFGNFEPSASYTHHPSGRVARPEEIVRASGFEDFNSRGGVVYLDKLEVVVDGQGYGKELLARFLDKPEFGLVFLHARDRFAYQYFLKQGFVDSRIKSGDDTVMVFTRDA
jgi:hypothetical protein